MSYERRLTYKVYTEAGVFIETLNDVVGDLSITKKINGGDNQFTFELDRKMDDFDENNSINFNNRIKIYLKDSYNTNGDKLVAYGYIVSYKPYLQGKKEGVEVTCLSAVSKLSNDFYRTGTAAAASELGVELTSKRADEMMEAIINHYRSTETNSMISNDFTNVEQTKDNSGNLITFDNRFFNMKHLDALREASKFFARNKTGGYWYYWRINTSGDLVVKNLSTTADHTFSITRHVKDISGQKTIEGIVNRVYFWNEKGTVDPDYLKMTVDDSTSQTNYDINAEYITDSKITNASAASLLADSKVYDKKDPKVKIKVTLNGAYDLASIEPGQTCKILNVKNNPFKVGSDNILLIHSVTYNVDEVILELAEAADNFEDIVENERQRLDKEMTWYGYITQQLTAAQLGPANRTWSTTVRFTATSGSDAYRQVDWTPGIVYIPAGASGTSAIREVASGTTGLMSSATDYIIYLDEVAKPTAAVASESGTAGIIQLGSSYLTDSSKSWSTDQWAGYVVVINSERRAVKSNTTTVLTTAAEFDSNYTGSYDISKWKMSVTSTQSVAVAVSKVIFSNVRAHTSTSSEAIIVPAGSSPSINIDGGTQIGNLSIPNAKIVDLEVSKLTAGTISSKAITLAVTAGSGDSYIAAGKTDFTNIDPGFILGVDDSDSDKAKFYIGDSTHYLNWTGTALSIAGNLSAGTIDIGGADTSSFHVDVDGNMWLGAATYDISTNPFAVSSAGVIRAVSGKIGGNTLGSDFISSPTFMSGVKGWKINSTGDAEFGNITARGELRTAVFVKDEIHSTGGTNIVLSSSILLNDFISVTSPSTSSLDLKDPPSGHYQFFVIDDIIRLKDGSGLDNWLKVTAVSDQTTYYSYTVDKQSGTNGTFYAGTAVVDYKQSTDGYVLSSSDLPNAPYIDIATNGATPWSGTTSQTRLGNLSGIVDPVFGSLSGYGLWTQNGYFSGSVMATSGRIGTSTNYWSISATGLTAVSASSDVMINYGKSDFGQDATNGFILGYDYSALKSKFEIGSSATKMLKYDGTDLTVLGGTITGGVIQTAATGERLKITASTTRLELINSSSSTVVRMNYGSTTTDSLLLLNPQNDSRRALEIITASGLTSDANAITIDNQAPSIAVDINNSGSHAIYIANAGTGSAINIHTQNANAPTMQLIGSSSFPAINIDGTQGDSGIEISSTTTNTDTHGIKITVNSTSTGDGLNIDNNAASGVSHGLYIDRAGNTTSTTYGAMIIATNVGATGAFAVTGLEISSTGIGMTIAGAPVIGLRLTNITKVFKVDANATDPTGGGGAAAGRIPIDVGGVTRYIAYY